MNTLFALKVSTDEKSLAFVSNQKEKAIVIAHSEITKALQSFAAGETSTISISFEVFDEKSINLNQTKVIEHPVLAIIK